MGWYVTWPEIKKILFFPDDDACEEGDGNEQNIIEILSLFSYKKDFPVINAPSSPTQKLWAWQYS